MSNKIHRFAAIVVLFVLVLAISISFQQRTSAESGLPASPVVTDVAGITGKWTADGNSNDSIGNNHLMLHNGVAYSSGKSGQAFDFNGSSYAKTTLPTYSLSGGTVSLWFKARSLGRQVITGGWNGGNGRTPTFYIDNGTLFVELSNYVIQPVMPITSNQWYHVAMTYDSTYSVKTYVNGVLVKQGQAGNPSAFPNEVGFGAYLLPGSSVNQFFDGLIDEISIYNRPLTIQEILQTAGDVPPTLSLPDDRVVYTSPEQGPAVVSFNASASDPEDGTVPVICTPPSGSIFPNGKTTVNCSATDNGANSVIGNFDVTVHDVSVERSHWSGDGNGNDSGGNNNHMTLHDGATYETGKLGQAFSFNGSGAYARTTLPTYSPSGGTVSLWFKTRSLGRQVITGSWNGGNGRTPTFYIDGGILYVELSDFVIQPVAPINVDQWYQVAMTYDSGYSVRVYVNGLLAKQGQASHPGTFPNEAGFGAYVGPGGQPDQFFNGLIDEISIYNRPLTAQEIISSNPDAPPFLSLPNDISTSAINGEDIAVVTFVASANDAVDGPRPVTCDRPSGSTFPQGTTIVNCSATDSAGNTATGTFRVRVFGAQGDLDIGGFNGDQGSFWDLTNYSYTRAVTLQADGKIVVGGSNYSSQSLNIARFNADGTPDTGFMTTPPLQDLSFGNVAALTMQNVALPGGGTVQKIVAAGPTALARFNLDGSLDSTFGTGGVTITNLPEPFVLTGIGLQSDNKIVASGRINTGPEGHTNFVALRFTPNGVLDTTFGDQGRATIDLGAQYLYEESFAMTVQANNAIVIGGYLSRTQYAADKSPENNQDLGLIRLNANGSLDTSFGTGGKFVTDLSAGSVVSNEGVMGLAVQRDGKMVAVGEYNDASTGQSSFLVTRHNANGSLDTTFGTGGKVITSRDASVQATDVVIQPDDKIVVLGGIGGFHLARYNPNGTLDPSFGDGGFITTSFYDLPMFEYWHKMVRQPDGKLVAAGTRNDNCEFICGDSTFVARYLAKSETVSSAMNRSAIYSGSSQSVSLTANVLYNNSNLPLNEGSVTFQLKSGGTNIGAAVTAAVNNGVASANYVIPGSTAAGTYTIEVSFGGTSGTTKSSGTGVLSIGKAATSSTVVSSTIPSGATSHTLLADIRENANPAVAVNAGTVTFTVSQGTTVIGTSTVNVSAGQASTVVNTSGLADGVYRVSASYSGTAQLYASSGTGSFTKGNSANPVPVINTLSPTSTEKSAASFTVLTVNGTGFMSTSNIRARGFDPQAGTIVEQNLTTSFGSSQQLSAAVGANAVLSRMATIAQTLEISVVSPTPVGGVGGGVSNKQAFFVTDTPVAVTNVASSTTNPTTGTTTATTTTTSGGAISATAVPQGAADTSAGTLTVAQYAGDPIGTNSTTTSPAFSDTSGGYFDVHVSPQTAADYETLSLSYCSMGTTLYWWTGTEWALVVSQSYNSTTGCINVTLNNTTSSPTITQLTGTVFGVSSGPAVGQITISPSGPLPQGTQIGLTAGFADPGVPAGMTYKAEVFWGDGRQTTIQNVSRGVPFSSAVAYPTPGVYTVRVKVTRSDNSFGSSNGQQFIVVTDAGASVSGGGWINSPAGAYTPNPTLTGKATFGFTSKYQNGAHVPSGNTQFTFHGAGMSFKSTAYEWLVVAGARAKYKGTGIINGNGNYGFMLTAVDGQINGGGGVDKFRVKIWDRSTGGIIYDNQMGASDDANPTTSLGGGSIVIHSGR